MWGLELDLPDLAPFDHVIGQLEAANFLLLNM